MAGLVLGLGLGLGFRVKLGPDFRVRVSDYVGVVHPPKPNSFIRMCFGSNILSDKTIEKYLVQSKTSNKQHVLAFETLQARFPLQLDDCCII